MNAAQGIPSSRSLEALTDKRRQSKRIEVYSLTARLEEENKMRDTCVIEALPLRDHCTFFAVRLVLLLFFAKSLSAVLALVEAIAGKIQK